MKTCKYCGDSDGVVEPSGYHATCSHAVSSYEGGCRSKWCLMAVGK
jgi:hypothetical protein